MSSSCTENSHGDVFIQYWEEQQEFKQKKSKNLLPASLSSTGNATAKESNETEIISCIIAEEKSMIR
jgi:hypothetical protein